MARLNITFASALTLSLVLSPCVHAADQTTLRRANGAEPSSLDPQLISGDWEGHIADDLFEGLLTKSADGRNIPGVATTWDIDEDGTVYTFHLRPDEKWSDGQPVTASDFVYAWQRILDPSLAADYAYMLYPVKNAKAVNQGDRPASDLGVEAVDAHTLKVTLERPTPYFLKLLSHYSTYPIPRHVVKEYGKDWTRPGHMVSDGAFELKEWSPQSRIVATKNPYFHDAAHVALDQVIYYPIEDSSSALKRFRAGGVDTTSTVPAAQVQWARQNLPDALRIAPQLGSYYYDFNQRKGSKLTDKRIRQALNLVVHRQVITDKILGMGQIPAYGFVPPSVSDYDGVAFDFQDQPVAERMKKAKALMKAAGYGPDHPLDLTISYNTLEDHKKIAVAIAAMWKPLGVNVKLANSEAAVHFANLQTGKFEVGRYGWLADYDDAENFLALFKTGVANNYAGYHNPAYDALLDQAAKTLDQAQRATILEHAERMLLDDDALLPLYFYVSAHLVSPDIAGWQDNANDAHLSRWISFKQ